MSSQDTLPKKHPASGQTPERGSCLVCQGVLDHLPTALTPSRTEAQGVYHLAVCQACGLEQTQPRLSEVEILALQESAQSPAVTSDRYSELVAQVLASPFYRFFLTIDGDWAGHLRALTPQTGARTPATAPRLLDIGCGQGRSSQLYLQAGHDVTGLEPSASAAQKARQRGLKVIEQTLDDAELDGPYEALLLANVLEHLEDPAAALQRCSDLLAPGGWLFLSCPNRHSWQRRLFGAAWINWYVPFHLSHFAPRDIEQLAAQAGLTVTQKTQVSPSLWTAQSLICRLTGNGRVSARWLRRPGIMAGLTLLVATLGWPLRALSNQLGGGDCLVYHLSKP
ncbi:class I SAM-dependent methyltransferase [Rhodovibrionaceae bacterium A322]